MNLFEKYLECIDGGFADRRARRRALKSVIAGAALTAGVLFGGGAKADDAVFQASAKILEPLQLENIRNLAFGSIVPHVRNSGVVVIRTNGSRFCASNLTCFDEAFPAEFKVTSPPGAGLRFQKPSAVQISNGSSSMTVDRMRISIKPGTPRLASERVFTLGARLNVGAAQAPGLYEGVFEISVDYE